MMIRIIKIVLDILVFGLTVFLVLYGLGKGFNLIELTTNLIFFAALISKLIIDFVVDTQKMAKS